MAGDAAAAATADGQGQEAQQGQQEAGQQGGMDPAAIEAQFAELGGGMNDLRQLVQGIAQHVVPQEGENGQEPDPEPLDFSEFLDPAAGQDPEQVAQRLQEAIQQQIQAGVQQGLAQHVQPLQQGLNEMRMDAEAERLVAEFPVLGESPEAAQQVIQAAHQLAQANGWGSEIANHPQFWRTMTLASIGARALQDEGNAGPDRSGAATLEGASGALPGGGSGGLTGQQIVDARKGSKVLPFG